MKILVTGAAGFIGMHCAHRLLNMDHEVVGIDNLNDYYEVELKRARLSNIRPHKRFSFHQMDVSDRDAMRLLFGSEQFDGVVHLAAQAGVRYSITNPAAYIDSNLVGFGNILEGCRNSEVQHLVYASSSSVYGNNSKSPFSEVDGVDHPISLYAATKRANELMAHSYSHLYGLPTTGLRFFTVYGPWGRPDMAPFLFLKAAMNDTPIKVFNHGHMERDFTYIDDIVDGIVKTLHRIPESSKYPLQECDLPDRGAAPFRIFNIGNSRPVQLMEFIAALEASIGKPIEKVYMPMQDGDVASTYADTSALSDWVQFSPQTDISVGVRNFVNWYSEYASLMTQ